jgi:tRNA dimethylallyltransferase
VAAPLVIAIFGPTASGKTAVAEALAEQVGGEVVSADAMQVYRGLPILTNQPRRPTRLVGIWDLDVEGSVGAYAPLAHDAIDELLAAGRTPIVTGGTGLYLRAALAELEVPPAPAPGVRERLEELYDRLGPDGAHAHLARRDPGAAARIHPHDRRRVVRALELVEVDRSLHPPQSRLWTEQTRHPTLAVGLDMPSDVLAERLERRTHAMFAAGVETEVERALAGPISRTARHIIGLEEIATLPREQAIPAIVARTRRYAAYQRKWMRRIPGIAMLNATRPPADTADDIARLAGTTRRPGRTREREGGGL